MSRINACSIKKYWLFLLVVCSFFSFLQQQEARAELRLDITKGSVQPVPIAISDFYGRTPAEGQLGQNMAKVISNNLRSTGLFQLIDPAAFLQKPVDLQGTPRFGDWRVLNAQALVSGSIVTEQDGRTRVEFRLWDVFGESQMTGTAYMTVPQNWRRIAHIISDEIYKRITGESGYFDSRIVYIAESGSAENRVKRLAIMDQDGENNRYLSDGSSLTLTPRFSPASSEITYLAFVDNRPRVYIMNIDTGRRERLGDFPGMTFAPRFSPDGNKVIMSQSLNGNSDIYVMDLRTRRSTQITRDPSIDTAPCYSPDGAQIVFESDRGGTQQLYVMGADGSNPKRITYGSGRYGNAVWSPRGDLIAFTKMSEGQFYIGVIRPDGSGERLITRAFHVEGPTWSPNGRVLMYFKESSSSGRGGKTARLYAIDITGANEREVPTPQDASDPAWSSLAN
ncbi:MAG: Tol-Pal system beta propeller repeat protein TolB [Alphaproteobacteria bacterium]